MTSAGGGGQRIAEDTAWSWFVLQKIRPGAGSENGDFPEEMLGALPSNDLSVV